MKEQLEALFEAWLNPLTRDQILLAQLFSEAFGRPIENCPKCKAKAINELRKYYELTYNQPQKVTDRKYVLLPGDHYFIAGDTGHNNDNTTDQLLEWYLKNHPYIRPLFIKIP